MDEESENPADWRSAQAMITGRQVILADDPYPAAPRVRRIKPLYQWLEWRIRVLAQALLRPLADTQEENKDMSEPQACYRPLPSALLVLATLALFGGGWAAARGMAHKAPAFEQVGVASWYGPGFHGKQAASGEIFNQNELTAAHRSLPLGAKVAVTNVTNGKSVKVEINDRGPYVDGRVIDLSRAAAIRLGMKDAGLAKVQIEAIPSDEG